MAWLQPDLDSTCVFSLTFYWFVGISASPVLLMSVSGTDIWHQVLFFKKTEILHMLISLEVHPLWKHDFYKQGFMLILNFWIRYFAIKVARRCWSRMPCCYQVLEQLLWSGHLAPSWHEVLALQILWLTAMGADSFPCRSTTVFHTLKNSSQYHLNAFWV